MTDKTTIRSDKFVMRLPDGWRDTLKIMAAKNRRTMNGEILAALEPAIMKEMEADRASA